MVVNNRDLQRLTTRKASMRAVVQRVKESKVEVKGETVGAIGPGLLILLGVGKDDSEKD